VTTEVAVNVDGSLLWARRDKDGNPSCVSRRHKPSLERVVSLLTQALKQAQFELGSMNRTA